MGNSRENYESWSTRLRAWRQWSGMSEPEPGVEFPPTSALPGTDEKIEVMRERLANRWPLWHKMDAGGATDRE